MYTCTCICMCILIRQKRTRCAFMTAHVSLTFWRRIDSYKGCVWFEIHFRPVCLSKRVGSILYSKSELEKNCTNAVVVLNLNFTYKFNLHFKFRSFYELMFFWIYFDIFTQAIRTIVQINQLNYSLNDICCQKQHIINVVVFCCLNISQRLNEYFIIEIHAMFEMELRLGIPNKLFN